MKEKTNYLVTLKDRSPIIIRNTIPLVSESKESDSLLDETKNVTYYVGDFIYFPNIELENRPSIVVIERLFTPKPGAGSGLLSGKYFTGSWFCYPEQTVHGPERRFMEREVFKTTFTRDEPISDILGKCYVLHVRDYVCWFPEGFAKQDVYVCESKYAETTKNISLVKDWRKILGVVPVNPPRMKRYDVPLRLYRNVPSVHAAGAAASAGDDEEVIISPKNMRKSNSGFMMGSAGVAGSGSGGMVYPNGSRILPGIPNASSIAAAGTAAAGHNNPFMFANPFLVKQQMAAANVNNNNAIMYHQQRTAAASLAAVNRQGGIIGGRHQFFIKDGNLIQRYVCVFINCMFLIIVPISCKITNIHLSARAMSVQLIPQAPYAISMKIPPLTKGSPVILKLALRGEDVHVSGSLAAARACEALGGTYRPTKKEIAAIGDPLMVFQNLSRCTPLPKAAAFSENGNVLGGDALDRIESFLINLDNSAPVTAIEVFLKIPTRRGFTSPTAHANPNVFSTGSSSSSSSGGDIPFTLVQCYTIFLQQ